MLADELTTWFDLVSQGGAIVVLLLLVFWIIKGTFVPRWIHDMVVANEKARTAEALELVHGALDRIERALTEILGKR